MSHTYEELKAMSVAQMREVAAGIDHPAVQGSTQMNKEHLLEALCQALNLTMHAHHMVVGINKRAVKKRIAALKEKRDAALTARDRAQLKTVRRKIHKLKRRIHKATV